MRKDKVRITQNEVFGNIRLVPVQQRTAVASDAVDYIGSVYRGHSESEDPRMNEEKKIVAFLNTHKEAEQTRQVLEHLFFRGAITDMVARDRYGISRLAAVIWKLRHVYGFQIDSYTEKRPNRWGKPVAYSVYSLA